jgi:hypothetical protein
MDRKVEYSEKFGMKTFKREIIGQLGEQTWRELIGEIAVPDIETEARCKCANMAAFMDRFDKIADKQIANKVLSKVRHGLKPSDSASAREQFLKIGDLDVFMEQQVRDGISDFEEMLRDNRDFYGQPVTEEVVDFVKRNPSMLSGVREENKLYISAFPAQMLKYLQTSDPQMKRYHACHCPFAKESILGDKAVSSTLCYCSLGHVMNFWEAAFDTELSGEVLTSALNGDVMCTYVVVIPDSIMKQYVNRHE